MTDKQFIRSVLNQNWEPFAHLAGNMVVDRVIEEKLGGNFLKEHFKIRNYNGTPFDVELSLRVVSTATSIIKIIIDTLKVYDDYTTHKDDILNEVHQTIKVEISPSEIKDTMQGQTVEVLVNNIAAKAKQ